MPINNNWKIIINCTLMVLFLLMLTSHYNNDFCGKEAELVFYVVML